ncbi:MAG: response regulator transcription factor [Blastococcus sp.]
MGEDTLAALEMAEIAASSDPLPRRGEQALAVVHRIVPFDSAWLALVDPRHPDYTTLADADLAESTRAFLGGPTHARELELAGTTRSKPPQSPSDLPFPAEELQSWAECLIPAGYHEGLAVALCGPGGRHIGFLAVLSEGTAPPPPEMRRRLGRLIPMVGRAVDPLHSLAAAAQLVQRAIAGVVVRADGGMDPLPGMGGHELLVPGSPALAVARAELDAGLLHRSFLWPMGGRHAPGGHARITVLARAQDLPVRIVGIAIVSHPGDLHGLTARELEVLGLIVEGRSNRQISRTLVVSQRTVAAHVEHILAKLSAPTRTHAAVRAERAGLYIPSRAEEGRPR